MDIKYCLNKIKKTIPALFVMASLTGCRTESVQGLTVYAFSAGAADAFLITTPGSAVLIDCGEKDDGADISAYLKKQGISQLDHLIITHFDKDHIGGAPAVLGSVTVKNVLQSDCPKDSKTYDRYVNALSDAGITAKTLTGDADISFELDGAAYDVDAPKGGYKDDESNNSSLIIKLTYEGSRLLFMGDAEDERVTEYLADDTQPYDLLKVPHHGRSGENLEELFDIVKPKAAVITSSTDEPEDDEVVEMLKERGAQVFLTRKSPVEATVTTEGIEVHYK